MAHHEPRDASGAVIADLYGNPGELNGLADRLRGSFETLTGQDKDLEVCKAFIEAPLKTDVACSYLSGEDSDLASLVRSAEPPVFSDSGTLTTAIRATQNATVAIGATAVNVRGFSTALAGADAQYHQVLSQPQFLGNYSIMDFAGDETVRAAYNSAHNKPGWIDGTFGGDDAGMKMPENATFLGTRIAERAGNFFTTAGVAFGTIQPQKALGIIPLGPSQDQARSYFTSLGYTGDFTPAANRSACAIAGHLAKGTDVAPKPACEGAQCKPYSDDLVFPKDGEKYPAVTPEPEPAVVISGPQKDVIAGANLHNFGNQNHSAVPQAPGLTTTVAGTTTTPTIEQVQAARGDHLVTVFPVASDGTRAMGPPTKVPMWQVMSPAKAPDIPTITSTR